MKIGLYYGSSTCYTEMAAEKIAQTLAPHSVTLHNIKSTGLQNVAQYDLLIFGISTWDYGELQEDWLELWDEVDVLNIAEQAVALFGLGDQIGYSDWFLDAMGLLHYKLIARQAKLLGYWPNEGYEFNESKALVANGAFFVGLALDDENQFELSDERISSWCEQILGEFEQL